MRAHGEAETKCQDDDQLEPENAARGSRQEAPIGRNEPVADQQE
jgi:hypothetical protein